MSVLWTPDLATGIELLDEQHKKLFATIDELLLAMSSGQGKAHVAQVLDFVERYVAEHFADEERHMRAVAYAGFAGHKRQHEELIKDILSLKEELAATGPTTALVIAVNTRLAGWLRTHVSRVDRAFARAHPHHS